MFNFNFLKNFSYDETFVFVSQWWFKISLVNKLVVFENDSRLSVMVNFMGQLNWARRCPDVWSNIILVCLWGCFRMRLTFESIDWVKQMALSNVDGPHQSVKGLNKTKMQKNYLSLPDSFWAGTSVFSCLWTQTRTGVHTIGSPGSQALGLGLEL